MGKKTKLQLAVFYFLRKLRHYEDLSRSHIILPIALETMGSFAPMALEFIKDLGSRIAKATGEKRATSYVFQSIGIESQRGNAASVLGTIPNNRKRNEIFELI